MFHLHFDFGSFKCMKICCICWLFLKKEKAGLLRLGNKQYEHRGRTRAVSQGRTLGETGLTVSQSGTFSWYAAAEASA